MSRQIILDTETTGLDTKDGHRIIELGCLEMVNRRLTGNRLHFYFNPGRRIDEAAIAVHGITNEFLTDKPRFADKIEEIMAFLMGAELIIHNAEFDLGFINYELQILAERNLWGKIHTHCRVLDTLLLARKQHPGQRNSLDALCKRYEISNAHRTLHGALLDAEILAHVYLAMTGGQTSLLLGEEISATENHEIKVQRPKTPQQDFKVIYADAAELHAHDEYLKMLAKTSGHEVVWDKPLTKDEND